MRLPIWRGCVLAIALGVGATTAGAQAPAPQASVRAGTLAFRDVDFGTGKVAATAALIEFSGFQRDGERVRADSVRIEGIQVKVPMFTLEVPSIRITGFAGPRDVVDSLSAGGSGADWYRAVSAASVGNITIDRIGYAVETDPPQTFTMRGITFDTLQGGKLARMRIATSEGLAKEKETGDTIRTTVGETLYEDVDLGEFVRFFTGGGSGDAKVLVGRATLAGYTIQAPEFRLRMGGMESSRTMGRAPAEGLTRADLEALDNTNGKADPAAVRKLVRYIQEASRYFSVERATVRDIDFASAGVTATLSAMNFGDYGLTGFGLFEFVGLDIQAPTGPIRLGRFAVEKLDFSPILDFAFEAAIAGTKPEFDPARTFDYMPTMDAFRLEGLQAATPEGPFALGAFTIETTRAGSLLQTVVADMKRLSVSLDEGSPSEPKERLLALGYQQILADARIGLRYDEAGKTFLIERTGAAVDQMGSVEGRMLLNGVDLKALLLAGDDAAAVAAGYEFGGLEINVVNSGLADRLYKSVAEDAGVSADAIRDGIAAEMRVQASQVLGPALASGSADQLAAFLRNPQRLIVRVAPRADRPPLGIADLQALSPPELADRVTVTIQATP